MPDHVGFPVGVEPPPTAAEVMAPDPWPADLDRSVASYEHSERVQALKFLGGKDPDLRAVAADADGLIEAARAEFDRFVADLNEAALPYGPTQDEFLEMTRGRAPEGTAEHAAIQARIAKRGRLPADSLPRFRAEAEATFRAKVEAALAPLFARLDAVEARARSFDAVDAATDADARVAAEVRRQLRDLLPADFTAVLAHIVRDCAAGRQSPAVLRLLLGDLRSAYHRPGSPYEKSGDLAQLMLVITRVLNAPSGPKISAGRREEVRGFRSALTQLARAVTNTDGRSIYPVIREQWLKLAAGYAA